MADRFNADTGGGFRGNTADFGSTASSSQRGSWNSEQDPAATPGQQVLSNQLPGNPHSSSGFKRAIRAAGRNRTSLKDQMPQGQTFSGKGYRKPSYFAQGGKRHGLHISTGAPATSGATQEGADFGGGG